MNNFPSVWMDTICTGNPQQVLNMYLPNAILVATYDPKILRGHAALLGYFNRFMAKEGLCGKVQSTYVQQIGRFKVFSGLYKFQFTEGGEIQSVDARYTFVVVPTHAGWKIAEHHSSEVPDA